MIKPTLQDDQLISSGPTSFNSLTKFIHAQYQHQKVSLKLSKTSIWRASYGKTNKNKRNSVPIQLDSTQKSLVKKHEHYLLLAVCKNI